MCVQVAPEDEGDEVDSSDEEAVKLHEELTRCVRLVKGGLDAFEL